MGCFLFLQSESKCGFAHQVEVDVLLRVGLAKLTVLLKSI